MAGFNTHLTVSCLAGVGYGVAGHLLGQAPAPTAAVAAGMCAVAGILPDADSSSAQTSREILGFTAAISTLPLLDALQRHGYSGDELILAAGTAYLSVRFGLGAILQRFTVHRGMWHSIPAALTAGLVTWHLSFAQDTGHRIYQAGAVVLGYLIHLVLDEFYSVEIRGVRPRFKKSFGTALKIWGPDLWANAATFANLAALTVLLFKSPLALMGVETRGGSNWTHEQMETSEDAPEHSTEDGPYY